MRTVCRTVRRGRRECQRKHTRTAFGPAGFDFYLGPTTIRETKDDRGENRWLGGVTVAVWEPISTTISRPVTTEP